MILTLLCALSAFLPSFAEAATLHRTSVYDIDAQEVLFDSDNILYEKKYQFSTTNPDFVRNEAWLPYNNAMRPDKPTEDMIIYTKPVVGEEKIDGTLTFFWENVGQDAKGNRIDIEIVVDNISLRYYGLTTDRDYAKAPIAGTAQLTESFYAHAGLLWESSLDFHFYAYKTGTREAVSGWLRSGVKDLDIPSYSDDYAGDWCESLELLDGCGEDVYVNGEDTDETCILDIRPNDAGIPNMKYYPTARDELDTYMTGLSFSLSADGGSFRWRSGSMGGTMLMCPFSSFEIESIAYTGGAISPSGMHTIGWKNTPEYEISADTGYKISSIKVDGEEVFTGEDLLTFSYKFSPVIANHKIEAFFEPFPVHIDWVDTLTGSLVASYDTYGGTASPVPALPQHAGHRFSHLSGDDWSCVMKNSIVYINYAPYLYDFPQATSSRYNGFTFAYREVGSSVSR